MSLHLWEAVHDAEIRSDPLFDIDPTLVVSPPPSLQRVLLAAAVLWCRTLTWPTVREVSTTAAVAASTSIRAAGSSARLRNLLVASELRTIDNLREPWIDEFDTETEAQRMAVLLRVVRLGAIDPALAVLPFMTGYVGGDVRVALDGVFGWVCHLPEGARRVASAAA